MAAEYTISGLQNEIVEELTIELSEDTDFNATVLGIKVKNAIREIRRRRNYPADYTEEDIARDLTLNYYDVIEKLALIEYNQIGAEGQSDHTEDDIRRTWISKDELLSGVHAFVTVL